jgi:hypothetical protein
MNMKINKLLFGLLGMAAISFTACSDDKVDYERGTWDANENYADIYFAESSKTVELDPADPLTTTLKVYRRVEHEYTYAKDSLGNDSITNDTIVTKLPKLTLKLDIVSNTDSVFEVGDAVFAEGDTVAIVTINFPKAEVGVPYTLDLQVTGADYVSLYSEAPATKLTVTRVKWNDAGFYLDENGNKVEGMCMFTDDFVTGFYGVDNVSYPIKVQERADKPGYFRLINVYHEDYPYNDPGDWDTSKDYYIYIDATNPKKVYIPHYCETGMSWSYGQFLISSMAGYYIAKDQAEKANDYFGTYANGKITFPKSALLIAMTGYGSGGFYNCNDAGLFTVVLDPTLNPYRADIKKDFDFSLDYEGKFISEQYESVTRAQLWKGVANNTTDKCDSVFAATYGTPYCLKSPYADGYDLYFTVKDGEVKIPEGYEIQATGDKAAGADIFAKISTMSTFEEGLINLVITFQNEDGSVVYGTSTETLKHVTYTKDMFLGKFTYWSVYSSNGKLYDLGMIDIVENPNAEDSVYVKDLYLEGAVVPARIDTLGGYLYMPSFEYLGIEEDEGVPYYIFTYANSGADDIKFELNDDGELVTNDLSIVGTPDLQNLYGWFMSTETTFVPDQADGARAKFLNRAAKYSQNKGHKGVKLHKSAPKNLKKMIRK